MLEEQLLNLFAELEITEDVKRKALARLHKGIDLKKAERERITLQDQLERAKELFMLGDWTESRYLREKARVELALAQLQPAVQPALNVQEAARLLQSYGGLIKQATSEEQKTFFATVLSEVFVENKKIVAIRPRPNYYDLLRLSLVRPNGFEPSQPCGH